MMHLQSFFFQQPKELRTQIAEDGAIWFVAKDVCDFLEIVNSKDAIKVLDEDEVGKSHLTDALGREQETNIINEPGLYKLIFRSNKPMAKQFYRWVTQEVLPQIRKTGSYGKKQYRVNGRHGRKLIEAMPLHLDVIGAIRSKMLWGDISLMTRDLELNRDRVKNYLGGLVQKPKLEILQRMQQWVNDNRTKMNS